ncbi:hypothetical protein GW916_01940 [bacterium]|nr:hypothetical protein [bacterium]
MKKMHEQNNENKTTNLVRAVLSTEVKFMIAVIGFVIGVISPYYQMRQDVALIQKDISIINSNHLMHTQDLTQEVKDIAVILQQQQQQITILQTQQNSIIKNINP